MPEVSNKIQQSSEPDEASESLQQALLRLTQPRYVDLRTGLDQLRERLDGLISDHEALVEMDTRQIAEVSALTRQAKDLQQVIDSLEGSLEAASAQIGALDKQLKEQFTSEIQRIEESLAEVAESLQSAEATSGRLRPVLVQAIHDQAQAEAPLFASAISPVIGPAIRHQIRSARQDIIDALYPVIGNIIGKAISEEFRTLSRKIDAQLRQQFNFQKRLSHQIARLRGVSEGELLLRDALPFSIEHVFLVHQKSGLLLAHDRSQENLTADPDLIGGMLTAIADFVRDSFGKGDGALEEVTYGDRRIMIEAGQYAYVAVVLEGVEPPGFNHLVRSVVSDINLAAEDDLREFNGVMQSLPDFLPFLHLLLDPDADTLAAHNSPESLARGQRLVLAGVFLGIVLMVGGLALACLFAVRLWPLVFP